MKKTKLLAGLEQLGLSSYESQAYLAALANPPMTGYQLSKASGVPRSRVYDTIEKLTARGLLVSQPGERNLLSAVDHRAFLDQKGEESAANLRFLREELDTIHTPEPAGIWTVSGRERILELAVDLIRGAEKIVYLIAVEADLDILGEMLAAGKSTKATILGVYCGERESAIPGLVRHLGPDCSRGSEIALVVDGMRALVGCTEPDESASAALTQNIGLVSITEQYAKHEIFINSLYANKDKSTIQAYIRQYDRTMKKLP